jgi:hypothetical protein
MRTAVLVALAGLAAFGSLLGGCSSGNLAPFDENTKYRIDNTTTGFTLTVEYQRRHFIPEPEAVTEACKNAFATVAQDIAAKRNRRIEPIDPQQISAKLGRNERSSMTWCTATAPVAWQ